MSVTDKRNFNFSTVDPPMGESTTTLTIDALRSGDGFTSSSASVRGTFDIYVSRITRADLQALLLLVTGQLAALQEQDADTPEAQVPA